ncbi:MAG: hypothetical protein V3T17_19295 [Pseudomonadales bacterium]
MTTQTNYLNESVYPRMDAADSGLLGFLHPARYSKNLWQLTCPQCSVPGQAIYEAGTSHIRCKRRKCGKPTSLADSLCLAVEVSPNNVTEMLCEVAGVPVPTCSPTKPLTDATAPSFLNDAIKSILIDFAKEYDAPRQTFCQSFGFTEQQFKDLEFGYYPSSTAVKLAIKKRFLDRRLCEALGYFSRNESKFILNGTVILFWTNPDGHYQLYGIKPKRLRKYEHALCFPRPLAANITTPYQLLNTEITGCLIVSSYLIETEIIRSLGYRACSIGHPSISQDQCLELVQQNFRDIILLTDSSEAASDAANQSIECAESYGITTNVCIKPAGEFVTEELFHSKNFAALHALIGKPLNGGAFLAHQYAKASYDQPANRNHLTHLKKVYEALSPISQSQFDTVCTQLNCKTDDKSVAAGLFSKLLQAGLSHRKANSVIQDRFGLSVEITPYTQANEQEN